MNRSSACALAIALGCATFGCGDKTVNATSPSQAGSSSSGGAGGSGTAGDNGTAGTGTAGASGSAGSSGTAGASGSASGTAGASGSASGTAGASGSVGAGGTPGGLPAHVLVGWGTQDYSDTWPKNSGTKYDVQWTYLSGQSGNNWYNDFTYGAADGSFLTDLLNTVDSNGFIPGLHLYNMGYGHDQGDAGLVTEIQDVTWTTKYFTELKVFFQKIKAFGKPVIVVLEGDSFGMVEMLVKNDSTTMAAVASTGIPELAALPNTVAGFGMAFLALRKAVGVPNIAMGPDTPYYAANGDIMNYTTTDALQPHVDYQWSFFSKLGVGPNQTGDQFDFSASCPRAADQDSYTDGRAKWSASDSAPVTSASINRYVEWLSLYHQTSGRPWMLHQVPIGNSQHSDTTYSSSTARSGYKDILVEYLFQYESPASPAIRSTHVSNFANAGVLGFLFGFSDDGDQPTNDLWTDNQPFFNTHVQAFVQAGGYPL